MLPPLLLKYKLNYIRLFCSNRPQNLCWLCQVYSNFCIKRKTIDAIRSCRRKHKIGNVAPALAHQSTSAIEMIDPNHMTCWIMQFGSSFPESSNRNNAACILTGYLANHSAVKLKSERCGTSDGQFDSSVWALVFSKTRGHAGAKRLKTGEPNHTWSRSTL